MALDEPEKVAANMLGYTVTGPSPPASSNQDSKVSVSALKFARSDWLVESLHAITGIQAPKKLPRSLCSKAEKP